MLSLLAILIVAGLERLYRPLDALRKFTWFAAWTTWVHARTSGALASVCTLAPPLIGIGLLQILLAQTHWLAALLFGAAILLLSIGPRELHAELKRLLKAWAQGDAEQAQRLAKAIVDPRELPDHPARLVRVVAETAFVQANERLFAAVFWFLLLGPVGAALYRVTTLYRDALRRRDPSDAELEERFSAVSTVHALLARPTAYLAALGYAVVGDFAGAVGNLRARTGEANEAVLVASGLGALRLQEREAPSDQPDDIETVDPAAIDAGELRAADALILRSEIFWLTLFVLLTLVAYAV